MTAGDTASRRHGVVHSLDARFDELARASQSGATKNSLDPRLTPLLNGGARMTWVESGLRLIAGPSTARHYTNAQLDDYHRLRPRNFLWRPPLRLRIRARASRPAWPAIASTADTDPPSPHYLRGTAGFGFWNGAPSITGGALRLPESIWFFAASPPSNMALMPGLPGYGWKAQVTHSQRPGALAAVPPMAAAALWARLTGDERPAARWLNRLTGVTETPLDSDLSGWHEYTIEWRAVSARFLVDGQDALTVSNPPPGPLGFVTWIDNQYAIATPRGALRFGALDSDEQWLELATLSIQPL